jgi:hypothetical protein
MYTDLTLIICALKYNCLGKYNPTQGIAYKACAHIFSRPTQSKFVPT